MEVRLRENIIRLIQKGDRKAFREIFDHFFNPLSSFGYKYVPDQFAVEDMVQEVFISFWEKRQDFHHINALKSFLYTSLRNKCLNYIKHLAVERKHEASLVYELESDQHFTNHVIEEEVFNQLLAEIKLLPDAAQEIMVLAMNGMKNQEIADELGISINTVKTQKKIAYSKIKDKMGHNTGMIIFTLLTMILFSYFFSPTK